MINVFLIFIILISILFGIRTFNLYKNGRSVYLTKDEIDIIHEALWDKETDYRHKAWFEDTNKELDLIESIRKKLN